MTLGRTQFGFGVVISWGLLGGVIHSIDRAKWHVWHVCVHDPPHTPGDWKSSHPLWFKIQQQNTGTWRRDGGQPRAVDGSKVCKVSIGFKSGFFKKRRKLLDSV